MSYPYVQSYTDLGVRRGPILGFVVHMAEGGGTVGYLSRANPNGVSVHYVIERTGRIVQMLRETHMHSSIRTSDIRRTDDPDGFYGRTAAVGVLGEWADTRKSLGPNHATIAVEVEGFAKDGPSPDAAAALVRLAQDLHGRYKIGNLGHRDFADYKACPGKHIDWDSIGGHGPQEEPDLAGLSIVDQRRAEGFVSFKEDGHAYVQVADREYFFLPAASSRKPVVGFGRLKEPLDNNPGDRSTVWIVGGVTVPPTEQAIALAVDVDDTEAIITDDAVAAELERAAVRAHDAVLKE